MLPDWLENELDIGGSSLDQTYEYLYKVFCSNVRDLTGVQVDGMGVSVDLGKDKFYPQYERSFVHFVTRENGSTRIIDFDRAKKLHWIRPVLEHYLAPEVYSFWHDGPQGPVLYIWLHDNDYVLILKNQRGKQAASNRIIVTAYNVDPQYRRTLQRRYGAASRILQ